MILNRLGYDKTTQRIPEQDDTSLKESNSDSNGMMGQYKEEQHMLDQIKTMGTEPHGEKSHSKSFVEQNQIFSKQHQTITD